MPFGVCRRIEGQIPGAALDSHCRPRASVLSVAAEVRSRLIAVARTLQSNDSILPSYGHLCGGAHVAILDLVLGAFFECADLGQLATLPGIQSLILCIRTNSVSMELLIR